MASKSSKTLRLLIVVSAVAHGLSTAAARAGSDLPMADSAGTGSLSYAHDGIDIYSPHESDDGENHYVHVSVRNGRYVFNYCKNGVSVSLARKGAHPVKRDCYLVLGSNDGYTLGEIKSELRNDASTYHWELAQQIVTTAITSTVVFGSLAAIDVLTDGANVPLNPVEALGEKAILGRVSRETFSLLRNFNKTLTPPKLIKAALSAGTTTLVTNAIGTGITAFSSSKIDDNDGAPVQMLSSARQIISALTSPNCLYVTKDSKIQAFEHQISAVLTLIQ